MPFRPAQLKSGIFIKMSLKKKGDVAVWLVWRQSRANIPPEPPGGVRFRQLEPVFMKPSGGFFLGRDEVILVIDFEATCSEGREIPQHTMEIIEIGAVWATWEGEVVDTFQALVRPVVHPRLTPFCMTLTGIQQEEVDTALPFSMVVPDLAEFSERHAEASGRVWGSWGNYDAGQLESDAARHGLPNPLAGWEHQNLKNQFAKQRKIKRVGMARALQIVGLPLDGSHHRGLDDAKNIARLLPWAKKG
jgi:inhibitor of KinA sporulation pathway (predicted exonuclease)